MNAPLLRDLTYTENGTKYRMYVRGGLHYINGNNRPYFTLTADVCRIVNDRSSEDSAGCQHDLILRYFPELADLAALHMSSDTGLPMHAESNGWYWLAGALGGAEERYHGGNSQPVKTPFECLEVFAKHCRIDMLEATRLRNDVQAAHDFADADMSDADRIVTPRLAWNAARDFWRRRCDEMSDRHNREAQDCIFKHGLTVFGDPWQQAA